MKVLGAGLQQGRFWIQDQVARYPSLLRLRYLFARGRRTFLVDADTDLIIEGYPRSANTYAAWAFRLTNPQCRLAHHVHSYAHVVLALRYGIPALVLLRPPADAVRSLVVRRPEVTPGLALRRYIAFHDGVAPYADKLLFARFETMIEDYDRVIGAVNRRFGTRFNGFDANVDKARVFEAIDEANRRGQGGRINPFRLPRPHPDRERMKASTSLQGQERSLRQAENLYHRLADRAV